MKAPTPEEIKNLKRLASGIVRTQGNRFIKELLRKMKIPIGTKKDDFERHLNDAIESGEIRLPDVEEWLKFVEGWGNQHVYLYNLAPKLKASLTAPKLRNRVKSAGLEHVWDAETVLEYPDDPTLTSISFKDRTLRIIWQEASPGWKAVPDKNFLKQEGLDEYEYRAYRKIEHRAITRFEAHLTKGIAALFIADPILALEHEETIKEAKRVIGKLMDLSLLEDGQFDIAVVSRNLDQKSLPMNSSKKKAAVKTKKSRLAAGGSYVEFAAISNKKAYWQETAIRDVRDSVKARQISRFRGTEGVFIFDGDGSDGGLERPLTVQLYGKGARVRLGAQMNAQEVWTILTKLGEHQ